MHKAPDIDRLRRDADKGHPAAEYNLGVWHLTAGGGTTDYDTARRLFDSAASKGFGPALSALGYMHLRGQGGPVERSRAVELFRRAAEQGFVEARYRLSELMATGCGTSRDLEAARAGLEEAAGQGHMVATTQLAYCLANGIGGDRDGGRAARLYVKAAMAGEPRAQCRIGAGYENGDLFPADPESALTWYLRARDYGNAPAACRRLSAVLDAEQVSNAERLAVSEDTPAPMPADVPATAPAEPVVFRWAPRIFLFRKLLTDEECHHLITLARPFLRPAMVLSRRTGERIHDQARTSHNARLINPIRDILVDHLEERLARYALLPRDNAEPITILRYGPGDEYKPHADYYDPRHPGSSTGLEMGGQRVATFLVYLNDVESGGATSFPRADLSVTPECGAGLLFFNCTPDGDPDRRTLHAGEPVTAGEKWLLSRWIRTNQYPVDCG